MTLPAAGARASARSESLGQVRVIRRIRCLATGRCHSKSRVAGSSRRKHFALWAFRSPRGYRKRAACARSALREGPGVSSKRTSSSHGIEDGKAFGLAALRKDVFHPCPPRARRTNVHPPAEAPAEAL